MTPNINLSPDMYRKLGQYGNRDESWDTIVNRLLANVDEEAVLHDRDNREAADVNEVSTVEGEGPLSKLKNHTRVRHRYQRGKYSGETVEAEIIGDSIHYAGESWSPSGAAIEADSDVRQGDANPTHNGWKWWAYPVNVEEDEWRPIDDLRPE